MAKSRVIDKRTREAIAEQIKTEIDTARLAKRPHLSRWKVNEDLLNESERFKKDYDTRSQIALNKMRGHIQTVLAKIDDPLSFKFSHTNLADKKKVDKYNALKEIDADRNNWDFKDLLGKRQAIFYGRTVYFYFATGDKDEDYKSNLNLIDVYDFLIDPKAGGLDLEEARYMGHYNVRYSRTELEDGIKSGKFIKESTNDLLDGQGTDNSTNEEEINKQNRYAKFNTYNSATDQTRPDDYRFWAWCTTYKGERYYAVYSDQGGAIVRLEKLKEIQPSGNFPYWSWASHPDHVEFWSNGYADDARDIIMAQSMTINQMMDNADRINNPQRVVNVTALIDENELRFKKRGFIRTNADARGVFEEFQTPSIDTPLAVYETLENILQLNSGVTGAAQGIAEEDKVGIYQGNQVAVADRFNLLNKSYSNGYKKFAILWKEGIDEHLNKKTSIKLLGPNGIEMAEFTEEDKETAGAFETLVESSNSESQTNKDIISEKIQFLGKYQLAPFVNPKVMFEIEAEAVGYKKDDIKRMLNLDDSNVDIQVEAYRDIQNILEGKEIEPNEIADTVYVQIVLDYIKDHKEDMKMGEYNALMGLYEATMPIVKRNMVVKAQAEIAKQGLLAENGGVPNIINNEQMQ